MIHLHLPHQDLEEMSHKKRQQVSLSSKVCKFFDFFVVADKSTTIFMGFNQTEVLHLWILNQMFCEYIGQLNLPQKIYLCKKFIIYFIWCIEAYITNHADKIFLFIEIDEMTHTPQLTQVGAKRRNGIWRRDRRGNVTCVGH